jgi:hypothetical protein
MTGAQTLSNSSSLGVIAISGTFYIPWRQNATPQATFAHPKLNIKRCFTNQLYLNKTGMRG